jgi:hypothetical protein
MWLKKEELLNWKPQSDVAKPYPVGDGTPTLVRGAPQ